MFFHVLIKNWHFSFPVKLCIILFGSSFNFPVKFLVIFLESGKFSSISMEEKKIVPWIWDSLSLAGCILARSCIYIRRTSFPLLAFVKLPIVLSETSTIHIVKWNTCNFQIDEVNYTSHSGEFQISSLVYKDYTIYI